MPSTSPLKPAVLCSAPTSCTQFCLAVQQIRSPAYCTQGVVPRSIPRNLACSLRWTLDREPAPLAKAFMFPTALESIPSVILGLCTRVLLQVLPDYLTCRLFPISCGFFTLFWIQIGYHGYVLAVLSTHSNLSRFVTWAPALCHLCSSAAAVYHSPVQPSVMSHYRVPNASDPIAKEREFRAVLC